MIKIPYGIIDYKVLREDNYYYVDKTDYIEKLEDIGRVVTYLRPGRFGKSLFTSMLNYYYDVNSESLFASLFKGTYVYDNPTRDKNNYYILKFDFSGMTTSGMDNKGLETEFLVKIADGIKDFNDKYKVSANTNFEGYTPNRLLLEFLSYFRSLDLDHKLYILIDEYDNFTNAILEGNGERFKSIVGNEGFIKAFYAVIKEYYGLGVIDRVFITGICPITLDSMTTGFNIVTDISSDREFNSMIGLTHEEVKKLISDIEPKKQKEIFDLMVKNYDGYLFNYKLDTRVFNATLVMYFLRDYYRYNQIPDELMDSNIAFNYGKIENLLKLQNNEYWYDIIDSILKTGEVTGELKNKFNLSDDFDHDDIVSLLYYFGYLTIKEIGIGNTIIFKIPNYVMKELYSNYFLKLLRDNDIKVDSNIIIECIKEIIFEGKIDKISNYISEILKYNDNRVFRNFDEKYIEVLYFGLLTGKREFTIYNEYPCSNGYIDVMFFRNNKLCKYDIMIELKYIKKSDYSDDLLKKKNKEASEQLVKYSLDDRIDKDKLKRYVVIFVGNDVKMIEEV